jgi:hypothetical protein
MRRRAAAPTIELRMRGLIFLLADSQSRAAACHNRHAAGSPRGCARRPRAAGAARAVNRRLPIVCQAVGEVGADHCCRHVGGRSQGECCSMSGGSGGLFQSLVDVALSPLKAAAAVRAQPARCHEPCQAMGGADRCCCHWQARDAVANHLGNSPESFPPPEVRELLGQLLLRHSTLAAAAAAAARGWRAGRGLLTSAAAVARRKKRLGCQKGHRKNWALLYTRTGRCQSRSRTR